MIEFNHLSYEKAHINSEQITQVHKLKSMNDFSYFLLCKNDWIQSFIKWKSACYFRAELPMFIKLKAILVIFLSVGKIEFNHLSYEKAHVDSKQNYAGP